MKIFQLLSFIINKALNLLFPSYCLSCASETNDPYTICDFCWKKLYFITEPNCKKCYMPAKSRELILKCDLDCLYKHHKYASVKAVLVYESVARELIHILKYSTYRRVAQFFAKLICNQFGMEIKGYDIIIPVPMHFLKLKDRGYNQASILAVKIARILKMKYFGDALIKFRNTASQMTLSEKLRHTHLIGAFKINRSYSEKIIGKRIAIIDDVFTTGSTAHECAKVLLASGAEEVGVFIIAKTIKKNLKNNM